MIFEVGSSNIEVVNKNSVFHSQATPYFKFGGKIDKAWIADKFRFIPKPQ